MEVKLNGVVIPPASTTPTGPAGGALAGTYPDPSLNTANTAGNAILKGVLTTTGALVSASAANTPTAIAAGAVDEVLTGNGAGVLPSFKASGGIPASILTTRGQMIRAGAGGTAQAFAAQTLNTFVGGDGTDAVARTAAQVFTSLGIARDILPAVGTPTVGWLLNETTGTYVSRGSTPCALTVTGAAVRDVAQSIAGRTAIRFPNTMGIYAAGPSGTTGLTAPCSAITLSAWVRWRGATGINLYQTILCLQLDSVFSGNIACIYLGLRNADGFLRVVYTLVGQSVDAGLSASGMSASAVAWRHLVATYNGTLFTFYLDGQPIGTHTPSAGTQIDLGTTSRWVVGDIPGSAADYANSDVCVADVFQSTLTAANVEALYARGMGEYPGP